MDKQIEETVARLDRHLPEGPSASDEVRAQSIHFTPSHWATHWPDGLEAPAFLAQTARTIVSRQDLFERFQEIHDEQDAVEAYVLMCGWGAGNRRVSFRAKPLSEAGFAERLLRSYSVAQEGDPVETYRRMRRDGDLYMSGLGPSYFTKWMYFSAYDNWNGGRSPAPLILDQFVALALGWSRTEDWSSAEYWMYLQMAENIRDRWAPEADLHCIEHALFTVGKMV
jgi:hypothetical protein